MFEKLVGVWTLLNLVYVKKKLKHIRNLHIFVHRTWKSCTYSISNTPNTLLFLTLFLSKSIRKKDCWTERSFKRPVACGDPQMWRYQAIVKASIVLTNEIVGMCVVPLCLRIAIKGHQNFGSESQQCQRAEAVWLDPSWVFGRTLAFQWRF